MGNLRDRKWSHSSWQRPVFKLVFSTNARFTSFKRAFNRQWLAHRWNLDKKILNLILCVGIALELYWKEQAKNFYQVWHTSIIKVLQLCSHLLDFFEGLNQNVCIFDELLDWKLTMFRCRNPDILRMPQTGIIIQIPRNSNSIVPTTRRL